VKRWSGAASPAAQRTPATVSARLSAAPARPRATSATHGVAGTLLAVAPKQRRLTAAATAATATWQELLSAAGPDAVLERFSHRYDALRRMGRELDDLTMVCVKVDRAAECAA
jgi:hypothetical protein